MQHRRLTFYSNAAPAHLRAVNDLTSREFSHVLRAAASEAGKPSFDRSIDDVASAPDAEGVVVIVLFEPLCRLRECDLLLRRPVLRVDDVVKVAVHR